MLSIHASAQNETETGFVKANQAFKEGDYSTAAEGYERIIQSGNKSGHLLYNLGNAYFRMNQIGRAILNYERAYFTLPRDADLNFNLRHARDQMLDAVPETSGGFLRMAFFWLDSLTLKELLWAFAVLNFFFWGTLLIRLFRRSDWSYYVLVILLILWVIGGASFGLKWHQTATDDRAVILEKEINVLAGPDENDTVLFKLHEGTIVTHERSEDGWFLVSLPDKKRGWVMTEAVERILPEIAR